MGEMRHDAEAEARANEASEQLEHADLDEICQTILLLKVHEDEAQEDLKSLQAQCNKRLKNIWEDKKVATAKLRMRMKELGITRHTYEGHTFALSETIAYNP